MKDALNNLLGTSASVKKLNGVKEFIHMVEDWLGWGFRVKIVPNNGRYIIRVSAPEVEKGIGHRHTAEIEILKEKMEDLSFHLKCLQPIIYGLMSSIFKETREDYYVKEGAEK